MPRIARAVVPVLSRAYSTPSGFSTALDAGEKLVKPASFSDPILIVSHEMSTLARNIALLIGLGHPTLNKAARYYFESESKRLRPLVVLLLSKTVNEIPSSQRTRLIPDHFDTTDQPQYKGTSYSVERVTNGSPDELLTPMSILQGINPKLLLAPLSAPFVPLPDSSDGVLNGIYPKQRRLAEIVELIHTALLLHDDVIDHSDVRRGRASGNVAFSNKMAVLAGDFLLGRASVAIARLRNPEVIELISTLIANLVEGEFMQLKNTIMESNTGNQPSSVAKAGASENVPEVAQKPQNVASSKVSHAQHVDAAFQYYLHKTYLKTAALISKLCRLAAVLSGALDEVIENCYQFGRHMGVCFQLVDDILDYTRTSDELGKPAGADLELGLATGPVLYAWKEEASLGPLIARKFSQKGDIEYAVQMVEKHDGLAKTKALAEEYKNKALKYLHTLPDCDLRAALEFLTQTVTTRTK